MTDELINSVLKELKELKSVCNSAFYESDDRFWMGKTDGISDAIFIISEQLKSHNEECKNKRKRSKSQ